MKVIMNHITDPRITMSPNNGSDRSWVWSAYDYADGELKETVFALKFGDREIAGEFKTHFEDAQGRMAALLAGADAAPSEEVDAAAEEISKLSTEEKAADTEPKAEGNGSGEKDGKQKPPRPELASRPTRALWECALPSAASCVHRLKNEPVAKFSSLSHVDATLRSLAPPCPSSVGSRRPSLSGAVRRRGDRRKPTGE
eukprot:scaffold1944_cov241-Pinguiococcus_pyrenoidosus.AAC.17